MNRSAFLKMISIAPVAGLLLKTKTFTRDMKEWEHFNNIDDMEGYPVRYKDAPFLGREVRFWSGRKMLYRGRCIKVDRSKGILTFEAINGTEKEKT